MRRPTVLIATVAMCLMGTTVLQAAPPRASAQKVSCKKIREAVLANHTLDQIIAELDTDAEHVMKCTQKRGRRRAAPKAPAQKRSKHAAKPRSAAPAADKSERPAAPPSRPSSLRRAPHPLP